MSADTERPQIDFANHILTDWDTAMDTFFNAVDRKRRARDLNDAQVAMALERGYGDEVADSWLEWYGAGDAYGEDS